MPSFNMPPGCNVSDIPGNRPEDERAEALYEKIYDCLEPLAGLAGKGRGPRWREQRIDAIAQRIFKLCGEVYQEGYQQGRADEGWSTHVDR